MDANAFSTPPVNNALLPDIYNKLDAELQERTRVINTQLDKKLVIQERVLSKYQRAAERLHNEEKIRMRQELTRISNRLPTVGNIKNFCLGYFTRKKKPTRKKKGIPEEKVFMPFCERHFIHHLPTKRKFYKRTAPTPLPPMKFEDVSAMPVDAVTVNGVISVGDSAVADSEGIRTADSVDVSSDVQLSAIGPQRVFPASR